jgi:hypothetical protein
MNSKPFDPSEEEIILGYFNQWLAPTGRCIEEIESFEGRRVKVEGGDEFRNSRCERIQFSFAVPRFIGNSAMKYAKVAADSQQRASSLTALTFVRAARFVTLVVGAVVSIEFLAMSVILCNSNPLLCGLVLLPALILATWIIAAVLGTVFLFPRWLWAKSHDLALRILCSTGERSAVWDDLLDGPSRA